MKEMAKTVPDAASYAPITILVDERADGIHLSYDSMARLIAPYGSEASSRRCPGSRREDRDSARNGRAVTDRGCGRTDIVEKGKPRDRAGEVTARGSKKSAPRFRHAVPTEVPV